MKEFKDGSEYGIDLSSTKHQKMAEQLTTHSVLQETVYGWLKGTTMWFSVTDMANLTYNDFAEHIGCDANEYYFDINGNTRVYIWNAADREFSRFMATFRENELGVWVIHSTGSSQISMP